MTQKMKFFSRCTSAERASLLLSRKGSITVQAAMAVPIFFLALVCLVYLLEISAIQTNIRMGMQAAGKELAQEYHVTRQISAERIEEEIVEAIGSERLDRSIIVGGSSGIGGHESTVSSHTGVIRIVASYHVRLPVLGVNTSLLSFRQESKVKAWVGYSGSGLHREEIVYIAENGTVYHMDSHCTHLRLSIQMVPMSSVSELRNASGGRYHPCERCDGDWTDMVFITNTGSRYHSRINCSGLRRTIHAVPLSEVIGKRRCSRCWN